MLAAPVVLQVIDLSTDLNSSIERLTASDEPGLEESLGNIRQLCLRHAATCWCLDVPFHVCSTCQLAGAIYGEIPGRLKSGRCG